MDEGDAVLGPAPKGLLKRACAMGRGRENLVDSTLISYDDLNRPLRGLLSLASAHKAGRKLRQTFKEIRSHLSVFVSRRTSIL